MSVVSAAEDGAPQARSANVAELATRLIENSELSAFDAEFFAEAPLDAVRRVLEASERPHGPAGRAAAERVLARPDALAFGIGLELLARQPPVDAESALLAHFDSQRVDRAKLLAVLDPLVTSRSLPILVRALRDSRDPVRRAGRTAILSLRDHALSAAQADQASQSLAAAEFEAPEVDEFRRSRRVVDSVYRHLHAEALAVRDPPLADSGPLAGDAAEDDLVDAMTLYFAAHETHDAATRRSGMRAARDAVDRALARVTNVGSATKTTALTAMRAHMIRAIVDIALASDDPAATASRTLENATAELRAGFAHAPHDPYYFMPDDAMYGPAGPFAWLDTLRRRGRPDVRHTFFRALVAAERLEHPTELEPSDEPLDDPHSWASLWLGYASVVDGDPATAVGIATEIGQRLERAALWRDEWLVAEALVLRATARLQLLELPGARTDLESAIRKLEELDTLERQSVWEERRDLHARAVPGAKPLDRTLAGILGAANRTLAEALWLAGDGQRALATALRAVQFDPFADATVAFRLAVDPTVRTSPRAVAFFEQAPRRADSLLELSRLAAALGRHQESVQLFQTHLEWNALTPERRVREQQRAEHDPLLSKH